MRKKGWIICLLILGVTAGLNAQGWFDGRGYNTSRNVIELQAGYMDPSGTKGGLIFHGAWGIAFDPRVELSLALDYFHRKYTQDHHVDTTTSGSGTTEIRVQRELEHSTTLLPISANLRVRFPIGRMLFWYAGAGISYQFLFDLEKNHIEGVEEKRTYGGWAGMFRGGIEFLLAPTSSLVFEALYNLGRVRRDVTENVKGLTEWSEVNVSGFGIRGGVILRF